MCVVSFVGDSYQQRWQQTAPLVTPQTVYTYITGVSREEFDKLKAEFEALKKTLKLAKKVDELTGQPDCEMAEKVELIRAVAEAVGVDLEDIFAT